MFLRFILIVFCHLCLDSPRGLFPSSFATKMFYIFRISPIFINHSTNNNKPKSLFQYILGLSLNNNYLCYFSMHLYITATAWLNRDKAQYMCWSERNIEETGGGNYVMWFHDQVWTVEAQKQYCVVSSNSVKLRPNFNWWKVRRSDSSVHIREWKGSCSIITGTGHRTAQQ
jgi:hypothetical protein